MEGHWELVVEMDSERCREGRKEGERLTVGGSEDQEEFWADWSYDQSEPRNKQKQRSSGKKLE